MKYIILFLNLFIFFPNSHIWSMDLDEQKNHIVSKIDFRSNDIEKEQSPLEYWISKKQTFINKDEVEKKSSYRICLSSLFPEEISKKITVVIGILVGVMSPLPQ